MNKPTSRKSKDSDLRPEYDLANLLKAGVRGKYTDDFKKGTNLVLLDPDVAEAFRDDAAVNEALRLALKLADLPRGRKAKKVAHATTR